MGYADRISHMSIASSYPRLASLGLTIHANGEGTPYLDPTELRNALIRHSLIQAYPQVTDNNIPPPIAEGYFPWDVEKALRRLAQVPSACEVFP